MMSAKQNKQHSENHEHYNDVQFSLYCDEIEKQYKDAKENCVFDILKLLDLDRDNSDSKLGQAIDYFNENNGVIESDAPMDFLTDREIQMVHKDGKFRPNLYSMLLSGSFTKALENKTVFLQHSFEFGFDKLKI